MYKEFNESFVDQRWKILSSLPRLFSSDVIHPAVETAGYHLSPLPRLEGERREVS